MVVKPGPQQDTCTCALDGCFCLLFHQSLFTYGRRCFGASSPTICYCFSGIPHHLSMYSGVILKAICLHVTNLTLQRHSALKLFCDCL